MATKTGRELQKSNEIHQSNNLHTSPRKETSFRKCNRTTGSSSLNTAKLPPPMLCRCVMQVYDGLCTRVPFTTMQVKPFQSNESPSFVPSAKAISPIPKATQIEVLIECDPSLRPCTRTQRPCRCCGSSSWPMTMMRTPMWCS